MSDIHIVVLAAGKGTRMKSARPKVLHQVAGAPMIEYVLDAARRLAPATTTIVVGHGADAVRAALAGRCDAQFVVQEPQLGTGHALQQTASLLSGRQGTLVLLSGDVPMLTLGTLERLVSHHGESGAAATLVTAVFENPVGYGRIVRADDGSIVRVVEERDATDEERRITEINAGIYAFDIGPLFPALGRIAAANAQGEYYLPDLVGIYRSEGRTVATVPVGNGDEIRGINSRKELAAVSRIVRQERNEALMASGVTLEDPATIYIGPDVEIEPDTIIHPNVHLEGKTWIGSGCEIHANVRIVDSRLEPGAVILNFCVITKSRIGAGARIGPFAHLRPDADVREDAHVGNFVELKKTVLGAHSKANHLAYLGDATIGERVNVGAGTITCNYDGVHKYPTIIEDEVFIGSDSQLVAPVRVGKGAYVAAGSSIVKDVPPGSLGIARGVQVNKEGWVAKKKAKG
ncbi:MAG: bifunctional UDP-N-acetylglucosamine diphosphorylase/glucosamine-1-phosphate N-acetyltransferase GlmU [Bacteroidales bacterium]